MPTVQNYQDLVNSSVLPPEKRAVLVADAFGLSADDADIVSRTVSAVSATLTYALHDGQLEYYTVGSLLIAEIRRGVDILTSSSDFPMSDVSETDFAAHFGLIGRYAQIFNDMQEIIGGAVASLHKRGEIDQDQASYLLKEIHTATHALFGGSDEGLHQAN